MWAPHLPSDQGQQLEASLRISVVSYDDTSLILTLNGKRMRSWQGWIHQLKNMATTYIMDPSMISWSYDHLRLLWLYFSIMFAQCLQLVLPHELNAFQGLAACEILWSFTSNSVAPEKWHLRHQKSHDICQSQAPGAAQRSKTKSLDFTWPPFFGHVSPCAVVLLFHLQHEAITAIEKSKLRWISWISPTFRSQHSLLQEQWRHQWRTFLAILALSRHTYMEYWRVFTKVSCRPKQPESVSHPNDQRQQRLQTSPSVLKA